MADGLALAKDDASKNALINALSKTAELPALSLAAQYLDNEGTQKAAAAAVKTLPAAEQFANAKAAADKASNPDRLFGVIAKSNTDEAVAYLKEKYEAGSANALGALAGMTNFKVAPVLLAAADKDQNYIRNFVYVVERNITDNDRKCAELVKALEKAADAKMKTVVIKASARFLP